MSMKKSPHLYTADQVRKLLERDIESLNMTQRAYSEMLGVSGAFVNMVLRGKKAPSGILLERIGMESVCQPVRYRRVS